jgi:hypothetical protein
LRDFRKGVWKQPQSFYDRVVGQPISGENTRWGTRAKRRKKENVSAWFGKASAIIWRS